MLPAGIATNILWGMQSSVHLSVMFTLVAALCLFSGPPSVARLVLGSACSIAAAYSFASGLASSLALGSAFVIAELRRPAGRPPADPGRRVAARVGLVAIAHVVGLSAYFVGHDVRPPGHPAVLPHEALFWVYCSELLSAGLGRATVNLHWAVATGAFTMAPMVLWIVRSRLQMQRGEWALVSAWMASAAGLAALTYGRAGLGALEFAKSARYIELAAVMVPLTLGVWHLLVRDLPAGGRASFWGATAVFLLAGSVHAWSIEPSYRRLNARFAAGLACVQRVYADPAHGRGCPQVYPAALSSHLRVAGQLDLSFTRR
jgi:hypothetical protein